MSEPRTYKRRVYFIEKKFQTRFILKFSALVCLAGLLTIGVLYLLCAQSTTVSIVNSRVMVRSTADFLLPLLIQTVAIVTVLVGLATVVVTLFVSHKIVGPLYRLKKVIQALAEGDFSSGFRIRHPDQMQDLADNFNLMIQKLRQQLNLLKNKFSSLKTKLDNLKDEDLPEYKRTALGELKRVSEELNRIIQYFKS
jgi:methyl-accepting chemotaxis protein